MGPPVAEAGSPEPPPIMSVPALKSWLGTSVFGNQNLGLGSAAFLALRAGARFCAVVRT
jgi:hypothetical protein